MSNENLNQTEEEVVETDGRYSMTDLIENGDPEGVKMILGDRTRIRPAGKIRPGIKAPVGSCSPQQKALYDRLCAENVGFDTIDTKMLELEPKDSTRKSCLRPSNCDYFVVRDEDFSRKSDADLIRAKYADSDGRVRRFPCWFLMSERHKAIPHAFTAFGGGGDLRCVSFYNEQGKLNFRYLPRGVKPPIKPEDWKILASDDDVEATRLCGLKVSLTGAYHIQIPGIRSVGGVLVNTKSWYGLSDAMAVLAEVRMARGSFSGLFNGEPFFEMVKVQQSMKVDGKTTKQWIVTLELTVDMMDLVRYAEPTAVANRAHRAMQLLTGQPLAAPAPQPVSEPVTEPELPADLAADPEPSEPLPAVSERRQKCLGYLDGLAVTGLGLDVAKLYSFISSQKQGVDVADLSDEDLAAVCSSLQASVKKGIEEFKADLLAVVG